MESDRGVVIEYLNVGTSGFLEIAKKNGSKVKQNI